jgi:integrase
MPLFPLTVRSTTTSEQSPRCCKPGSIAALVDLYYRSRKWAGLSEGSKRTHRYILEPFVAEHGHRRVDQMEAKHVDAISDTKAATPFAANRKLLSVMMRMAIRQGWRKDNPVAATNNFKIKSKGYRTWTAAEVDAFQATYPIGTEERIASDLLLYTGQRVSDVVRMGREHVTDSCIVIKQQKSQSKCLSRSKAHSRSS